jgi:hypothetical protein
MLLLGEQPGPAEWVALVLMLAALAVVIMPGPGSKSPAEPLPIKVD